MPLFFSATAGGFFDDAIHSAEQIPDDAVAITAEDHAALMAAQAAGRQIIADSSGRPAAADPPPPDADHLWTLLRRKRDQRLAASDFTQIPDAPIDDEQRTAWAAYRQALRDLPAGTTDPAAITWPEVPA